MVYLDSLIGSASSTLTDPSAPDLSSLIGFATSTLNDPTEALGDSAIGSVSSQIRNPHHPIGTWTGAQLVYSPLYTHETGSTFGSTFGDDF